MRKTLFHHTHFSKIGLLSWTTQHSGDVEGGLMMSWHYEFFEVCKWLEIFHNTKNRVCVCTLNWIFCSELIGAGLRVTIPYPLVYLLCCDLTLQHNNDRIWASCLDGLLYAPANAHSQFEKWLDGICGSFENAMSWVAFEFTNVKWIDLESLLQKVHLAQFGMLCVLFIMEIWEFWI